MTEEEILRAATGIGITPMSSLAKDCEAMWERGLLRRDDVQPYTYTTQCELAQNEEDDHDG